MEILVIGAYLKALPILDSLVMTDTASSGFCKFNYLQLRSFWSHLSINFKMLFYNYHNQIILASASGSGSDVGYKCNSIDNPCTLEKFNQQDDAYSLCVYTGKPRIILTFIL